MSSGAEPACETKKVLVICLGNPLRSDDGLGWRAAEDLERGFHSLAVEIVTRFQLTPELAETVHHAQGVLFIDARSDGEPGELKFSPVIRGGWSLNSHHLSPEALLQLATELYGNSPPAFIVSICGECFDLGEHLSPKVAAELPRLTSRVIQAAERMFN
jgi:hydrogenase maturation protease